jgi:hypothetical protein
MVAGTDIKRFGRTGGEMRAGWGQRACAGAFALAALVCWIAPLIPAALINLAAVHAQGSVMAAVAIAFVVTGALAVEGVFDSKELTWRITCACLALFFVSANVYTALSNVAAASEQSRGIRDKKMRDYTRDAKRSDELSASRQAQFAIAGDVTPESIEAEIQAAKAANAPRWQATAGCSVEKITAGESRSFCSNLAQLAAKKAAAIKRDGIDAKLAALDSKEGGEVPESTDPGAENMAQTLETFGFTAGKRGRALLSRLSDWKWAVGVELIAAFVPALLLRKLRKLRGNEGAPAPWPEVPAAGGEEIPAPAARELEAVPEPVAPEPPLLEVAATQPPAVPLVLEERKPEIAIEAVQEGEDDPEIDAFIARRLEFVAGEKIPAGDLFKAWKEDCGKHGIESGNPKRFSTRIRRRVEHDKNGGHPFYRGVRLKSARPRLRVVEMA